MQPQTTITEIKTQVSEKLKIPADEQKLLFLGRALVDEQTVQSYPTLKDGSKLNLIIKKPEKPVGLYDVVYKALKKAGLPDVESSNKAKKFVHVIEDKFKLYSWDDIERLSEDCMREEFSKGRKRIAL